MKKIHQKIQRSFGSEYSAEVPLKHSESYKGFELIVEGRADGIITKACEVTIDEIKLTTNSISDITLESISASSFAGEMLCLFLCHYKQFREYLCSAYLLSA